MKVGVIRLRHEDMKTQEGRAILLTKELTQMLPQSTIYVKEDGQRVPDSFTHGGKLIRSIRPVLMRRPGVGRGLPVCGSTISATRS
jgi:hypothetical protein